jgi:hypothetical protein
VPVEKLVEVVCASHRRAGMVTAHKAVANAWLTVEERQVDEYATAHPELAARIVPHPDDLTFEETWTFVMERWPSHFWLDDTLAGIFRNYRKPKAFKPAVMSAERAYELVQRTADVARQLGCYLFGFATHANPGTYHGLRPFRFGGYGVGGAYGLLEGHKIRSTKMPFVASLGRDHYMCLLNAYHHRFAYYDCRFAAGFRGTYRNRGGLAVERGRVEEGEVGEVVATRNLQKLFGDAVKPVTLTPAAAGVKAFTSHDRNPGRREIVIPYRY